MSKNKSAAKQSTAAAKQSTAAKAVSKRDLVLDLLRRTGGASLTEITEATGWLPHSARAVLTGFRKRGFQLGKSKVEGLTHYSVTAEPSA